MIKRRDFLAGVLSTALFTPQQQSSQAPGRVVPSRVFWAPDPRQRNTLESCFFSVVLDRTIELRSGSVQLFADVNPIKAIQFTRSALLAWTSDSPAGKSLHFALREQQSLRVNRCELTLEAPGRPLVVEVQFERYSHRTPLVIPFRGAGMVDQAWMCDNGHANPDEQFAVDLLALSDRFARSELEPRVNEDYAGWGRELIAPGAGVIARVEAEVPNQPRVEEVDERSFTLRDGRRVPLGNHVVIDHGNGEYSLLVHMQPGSIPVSVGSRVRQGQLIGRLGNSGFSTEPHLHYQLQDAVGPAANSLPFRFDNMTRPMRRGIFFVAS
jgi:hypothetical protein